MAIPQAELPVVIGLKKKLLRSDPSLGPYIVAPQSSVKKGRWGLQNVLAPRSEVEALDAEVTARVGPVFSFDWTPPNEVSARRVRIDADTFTWEWRGGDVFAVSFDLVETRF